jgi:hypothetical protein
MVFTSPIFTRFTLTQYGFVDICAEKLYKADENYRKYEENIHFYP